MGNLVPGISPRAWRPVELEFAAMEVAVAADGGSDSNDDGCDRGRGGCDRDSEISEGGGYTSGREEGGDAVELFDVFDRDEFASGLLGGEQSGAPAPGWNALVSRGISGLVSYSRLLIIDVDGPEITTAATITLRQKMRMPRGHSSMYVLPAKSKIAATVTSESDWLKFSRNGQFVRRR